MYIVGRKMIIELIRIKAQDIYMIIDVASKSIGRLERKGHDQHVVANAKL